MTVTPTEQATQPQRALVRRSAVLAWGICGIICIAALVNLTAGLARAPEGEGTLIIPRILAWGLLPIVFAVPAALIIARQPRNVLGWILLAPPITFVLPVDAYLNRFQNGPPLSLLAWLATWFQNWSWILLIFPLLLMLLLFPTGSPPSPRFRWVQRYALLLVGVFLWFVTFGNPLQEVNGKWRLPNPIGFIPADPALNNWFTAVWVVSLGALVILCAAALFVRYRRANATERLQIKWLLFAGAVFVIFYIPLLFTETGGDWVLSGVTDLTLALSACLFPIAIAIAILRYRLWDIDVLINRTLVYVPLTAISAAIFSEVMSLSEKAFVSLTGSDSPVSAVIAAVIVVAAFNPIKDRVQKAVDRKFKEAPDPAKQLRAFQEQVRDRLYHIEVDRAARRLLDEAVAAFDAECGVAYLEDGSERRLIHAHGQWKADEKLGVAIEVGGAPVAYLALGPRRRDRAYTNRDRETLLQAARLVAQAVDEDGGAPA